MGADEARHTSVCFILGPDVHACQGVEIGQNDKNIKNFHGRCQFDVAKSEFADPGERRETTKKYTPVWSICWPGAMDDVQLIEVGQPAAGKHRVEGFQVAK